MNQQGNVVAERVDAAVGIRWQSSNFDNGVDLISAFRAEVGMGWEGILGKWEQGLKV